MAERVPTEKGRKVAGGSKKATESAAHARARAKETSEAAVRECVDLMASGQWISGVTHRKIAERRGVHPDTAMRWASSAAHVLRLAVEGDAEGIRSRMLATLGTIVDGAMNYQRAISVGNGMTDTVTQPDLKAAISAIDTQAKLLGLMVQKHEVKDVTPPMTAEQIRARLRELAAKAEKP